MDRASLLFGLPLAGLTIGAIVLVFGVFQGGLTTIAMLGGAIGAVSILLLSFAAFQASS